MNMNKTFFLRTEDQKPRWRLIDAEGQIVGRLATHIANALRGKDRAQFTPHSDAGDYVVVVNADKIVFSGNKMTQKVYERYSGYIGNKKYLTAQQIMEKHPERIITLAVKGMLPKNRLSRALLTKLRVYAGTDHPHKAQIAGFSEKA